MDRWQPLSTSDQQIRLLEVAPREQDSKCINCQLKIVSMLSNPTYEALSYVWGGWEDSREIMLDGSKHTVTKNLHDALSVMQSAVGPRTLWVDAVCIDQTNIQERTSQVAMMDKIYFQAEQVLVWLGERSKIDLSDKVLRYGKDHSQHYEEAPYDLFHLNSRFDTWWYRAWTFQEAALAKRILFHSGNNVFTDKDLEEYIESARIHLFSADACCREVFDKPGTKNLVKTAFSSPYVHLTHILDSRRMRNQRTEDLVSLILDNGIRSATGMCNLIKSALREVTIAPYLLAEMIYHGRRAVTKRPQRADVPLDPRDLVHAFIGLALDPPSDLIRYELPPKEWVVHVTGSLIRHSQSLDALRHVITNQNERGAPLQLNSTQRGIENDWHRMEGLPSWCPDWTQATRLRRFQERSQRRLILKDRFAAANGTTTDAKIRDDTVLEVSGILSDSVSLVGKGPTNSSEVPDNDCLVQWSHLVADSPAIHNAYCDGCSKTIYGVRHKCRICPDFDFCHSCFLGSKDTHPDHAFNDDLQPYWPEEDTDSETDENDQQQTTRSVWRELDKVRYPFTENSTLQDAFRNSLLASASALKAFMSLKAVPMVEEVAFAEWWQSRVEKRPFILIDAKNGFSQKEVGEMLNAITPQHVHMVKSLVHIITQNNTLIVGEKGYIGLGPKETRVGDMVVVLKGADTPFILRKVNDASKVGDEIYCTLVGEAYVHGLMLGEAIEAERAGLAETKNFRIR